MVSTFYWFKKPIKVPQAADQGFGPEICTAVFVRPDIDVASTSLTDQNDIKILTVEMNSCTVTSIYKPPNADFAFEEPSNFQSQQIKFVLGDFNCHSVAWGYNETAFNGEELEKWAESMNLKLIHDPKQPASFNSGIC
ncbi:uncharacterized protein LOC126879730 [Diabrotica virgifera virgifera]|uniref:Endonuclease/exonuclease/phosphatase domain-containing protein n=1 Tax=Diabrotica virgifera virgifera TaxID=50390 RepID=A0ABM5JLT5_DIAVI|nr:uncharacterized protein LOC126879730 [Diabrotica virgifera virgifera]